MPRIAFFPDSFHEVNGVAHTARHFVAFAQRREIPMLCVRAGGLEDKLVQQGSVGILQLDRGYWAVRVEQDLSFDPFFFRHTQAIGKALRRFRPDIIHITGPSELGLLGAVYAWRLGVPLAASWHTNVHEYASRRLVHNTQRLGPASHRLGHAAEVAALAVAARLYRRATVLYAPNPPLCELLQKRTGRPCHPMQRGVNTVLFDPAKRTRTAGTPLTLGFVGRLSVEKNVALLPQVHRELVSGGISPHWLIVGHGSEERFLRQQLGTAATFTGVLRGEALAAAYANMDLLVFPSHTDTFGNVVLEALASGVPAIVTPNGGPSHIVQHGVTGM
ncbi:MAG TPA: glycosyltransferase, partial [Acidobacteriaceae bacterium]|nr:glycosyltransferase [Acidobacteriaceae bacterium]